MEFWTVALSQVLNVVLLRPFKGYRTLFLSILTIVAGLSEVAGYTALISGPYGIWFVVAVAVANAIIRMDTDTKILTKE